MKKRFFIVIILSIVIISFILIIILCNKLKMKENSKQIIKNEESSKVLETEATRYYLHRSDLKIPERNFRYIAQTKAFKGLTDERKEYIKENFRYTHLKIERKLIAGVDVLKDKNSSYWDSYTKAGTYKALNGSDTYWESDGGFSKVLEEVQSYMNELENEIAKSDLQKACNLLREGIEKHDLSELFEAHEIIHDYDYWVFSVEPSFVTFPPEDWEGTRIYFGKSSLIED